MKEADNSDIVMIINGADDSVRENDWQTKTPHIPVLARETIAALNIREKGTYIDGTVGFGGHSSLIAEKLGEDGRLLCIDRDPDALEFSKNRLEKYKNVTFARGNFSEMTELANAAGITGADGILLDIGVSSFQLDCGERGFSFHTDAPLDMRMSKQGPTAADIVNTADEDELARILYEYSEEKFARRIAARIVAERQKSPIDTTGRLAMIAAEAYPAAARKGGHPARQTFQAIRIAVNGELDALKEGLKAAAGLLNVGGVLAVITFHSLEDRIVKQFFVELCKGCTCPPEFPVCICHKTPFAEKVTKKPVTATDEELGLNPRSRSAKLRAVRRIKE